MLFSIFPDFHNIYIIVEKWKTAGKSILPTLNKRKTTNTISTMILKIKNLYLLSLLFSFLFELSSSARAHRKNGKQPCGRQKVANSPQNNGIFRKIAYLCPLNKTFLA